MRPAVGIPPHRRRNDSTTFSFERVRSTLLLAAVASASAQNETALRTFFEGKRVSLKIDMPATSEGVDLRLDTSRSRPGQRSPAFHRCPGGM